MNVCTLVSSTVSPSRWVVCLLVIDHSLTLLCSLGVFLLAVIERVVLIWCHTASVSASSHVDCGSSVSLASVPRMPSTSTTSASSR
ncbi:hypothetical protein D3C80_1757680 [compost metagenome]